MLVVRRLLTALVLTAALAGALLALPAGAQEGDTAKCTLFTALLPGEEVPPSTSRAFGAAAVHINGDQIRFAVAIANLSREAFILGHIHQAPAGSNGPPVVTLFSNPAGVSPFVFLQADTVTAPTGVGGQICADPANYYVNYHTTARPGGTTRGQLG
jgi:hypothetical protein